MPTPRIPLCKGGYPRMGLVENRERFKLVENVTDGVGNDKRRRKHNTGILPCKANTVKLHLVCVFLTQKVSQKGCKGSPSPDKNATFLPLAPERALRLPFRLIFLPRQKAHLVR